jgi:UDP-2,3-diacylglucosamine pyrophosphatase LpxH
LASPAPSFEEVILLDAVLLSDLHLGSESCQVRAVQHFLDTLPATRRLVLNGDVLENTEHRLTKQHWRVLSRLRKLSDQLELIWVRGNHDFDAESAAHLLGAAFVPEYLFETGGRRILCVHGDAWDQFITDHPFLSNVADWFYLWIQRLSRRLAVRAKRSSKTFVRCAERVRLEAAQYARAKGADVVICGHTHHAEETLKPAPGTPAYFNTGCWTDHLCHYLTVQDGLVRLEVYVDELPPDEVPEPPSATPTIVEPQAQPTSCPEPVCPPGLSPR